MVDWKSVEAFASIQAAKIELPHRPISRRFQIMSDLHLELGQQYYLFDFPVTGSVLILAGNIGRLIDYEPYLFFLQVQATRYQKVLLVLGNQEFYGLSYDQGIETAKRLVNDPRLHPKVTLLHRNIWYDSYYRTIVFGCTLWSHMPRAFAEQQAVGWRVSDYHRIRGWTVAANNAVHEEDAAWLHDCLRAMSNNSARNNNNEQGPPKRNVLVVTHHAPRVEGTSAPGYAGNPWAAAFTSEVLGRMPLDRVRAWVFGHTEYTTEMAVDGMQLVSNQRGFVLLGVERREREAQSVWTMSSGWLAGGHKFDPRKTIEGPPRSAMLSR